MPRDTKSRTSKRGRPSREKTYSSERVDFDPNKSRGRSRTKSTSRSSSRSDKKTTGRSEKRSYTKRSDSSSTRSNNRSEKRTYSRKPNSRSEGRSYSRRSDDRSEKRSYTKRSVGSDRKPRSEGRSYARRSDDRSEKRTYSRRSNSESKAKPKGTFSRRSDSTERRPTQRRGYEGRKYDATKDSRSENYGKSSQRKPRTKAQEDYDHERRYNSTDKRESKLSYDLKKEVHKFKKKDKPELDINIKESRLKGIYEKQTKKGKLLFTINMNPGKKVYDESLTEQSGLEFREWNPAKSKLGAAIIKGISQIGMMPGKSVLYLGCSTGTTCSHVSDLLGAKGELYALDFAPRVMREFVALAETRENIAPIMGDANKPEEYSEVPKVDVVFQDIAQRDQVSIFLKNVDHFLKKDGFGLLAVKARSIDVTKKPKIIYNKVRLQLEDEVTIVDYKELDPFEKDHCLFVIKKK